MEFTLKIAQFKKLVSSFKDFTSEAVFICSEDGIEVMMPTPDNVCMYTASLKAEGFDTFKGKSLLIGFLVDPLNDVLRNVSGESMSFKYSNGDSAMLTFYDEEEGSEMSFKMRLMEIDMDLFSIPEIEFDYSFSMQSKAFKKVISSFGECDKCQIDVDSNITFSASGDHGELSKTYKLGGKTDIADKINALNIAPEGKKNKRIMDMILFKEGSRSSYSMRYMKTVSKNVALAPYAILSKKNDDVVPLKITYKVNPFWEIVYYIGELCDNEYDTEEALESEEEMEIH